MDRDERGRTGVRPGRREQSRERRHHRNEYDDYDDYEEYELPEYNSYRYDRDYDEPPRRRAFRISGGSLFWSIYKFVVFVSALIVAGYLGYCFLAGSEDQTEGSQPPPPITDQPDIPVVQPEADQLKRRDGVHNVMLAATDMEGIRTDTMMVLSYDVPNQKVGVVSVPRDTITNREPGKNPKLVYGPGNVTQRREDISNMLGIPIDYYVKVDIRGFVALVDYLGGVEFYVPCDMDYDDPYQNLSIHFKEGRRTLSGQEAMEVARFRKNNDLSGYGDTGRTDTQQKLLMALADKVLSWGSITKVKGFLEIFNKYVSTDLAFGDMVYFATKALSIDTANVETVTLEGRGDGIRHGKTWCYELDPDKTVETVNRLLNPYTRDLTLEDMDLGKADKYMQ